MILADMLVTTIYYVLSVYTLCVVAVILLNLIGVDKTQHPIVGFLNALVMPPCQFLAKKFPKLIVRNQNGFYDMSPVALIVILVFILVIINKLSGYFGFD